MNNGGPTVSECAVDPCPSAPGYAVLPRYDHFGDDVTGCKSASLEELVQSCNSKETCVGFNKQNSAFGSMGWGCEKSKLGSLYPIDMFCLYYKLRDGCPYLPGYTAEQGVGYWWNDLDSFYGRDIFDAAKYCDERANCVGFSRESPQLLGWTWTKNNMPQNTKQSANMCSYKKNTGSITPPTCLSVGGYASLQTYDHYGDDISDCRSFSVNELASMCNDQQTCLGFVKQNSRFGGSGVGCTKFSLGRLHRNNDHCLYYKMAGDCPVVPGYVVEQGVNYPNNDIRYFERDVVDVHDIAAQCNADKCCQGFLKRTVSNQGLLGEGWMKRSLVGGNPDASLCAYKKERSMDALSLIRAIPTIDKEVLGRMGEWLARFVAGREQPFCWKRSIPLSTRGIDTCRPGQERQGGLCYTPCREGFYGEGPVCWQRCPSRYKDIGVSCEKPASFGRGGGDCWWLWQPNPRGDCERKHGGGNCDSWGSCWYPKCGDGFHAVGCCVCSPNCINGMRDDGAFCAKQSYGRGAGEPLICPGSHPVQDGLLCYENCPDGYYRVGPVCWQKCDTVGKVDCAAGCAKSGQTCFEETTRMVLSVALVLGNQLAPKNSKVAEFALDALREHAVDTKHHDDEATRKKLLPWLDEIVANLNGMFSDSLKKVINEQFDRQLFGIVSYSFATKVVIEIAEERGNLSPETTREVFKSVMAVEPSGIGNMIDSFMKPVCGFDELPPLPPQGQC
jgi:hypothetical protein